MPSLQRASMALVGVMGLLATELRAQVAPTPVTVARRDTVAHTPTTRWQFEQCMGGVTYGAPFKWALAYGMGMVRETDNLDLCFLGAAKVGFGGASFSVGLANSLGHFGSGSAITVGLLRTFNGPMGALAKRTYAGASLHVWPLLALGGEIGYYTPLGADADGAPTAKGIVTWSAGFGF
jgi:hypothetical protein